MNKTCEDERRKFRAFVFKSKLLPRSAAKSSDYEQRNMSEIVLMMKEQINSFVSSPAVLGSAYVSASNAAKVRPHLEHDLRAVNILH